MPRTRLTCTRHLSTPDNAPNPERVSLDELVCRTLNAPENGKAAWPEGLDTTSRSVEIVLGGSDRKLLFHHDGKPAEVKKWAIQVTLEFEHRPVEIPVTNFAYRQELRDGALAWLASARLPVGGQEWDVCIVFAPDERGFLSMTAFTCS